MLDYKKRYKYLLRILYDIVTKEFECLYEKEQEIKITIDEEAKESVSVIYPKGKSKKNHYN